MKQDKITSLQYATLCFFLLNSFIMNIGFYTITNISFNDSLIDIILGGCLIFGFSFIIFYIHRSNDKNIIEVISNTFPKWLKLILFLVLFIVIGISIIYSLSILISFINYYILKEVGVFTITVTIMSTILYIVRKGLGTISKISEIFFYIYSFIIFISIIGLIKYIDLSNLRPLFITNFTNHVGSTCIYFLSSVIPLFLLLMIPRNKMEITLKGKKLPIIFIVLSIIFIFMQIVLIISVLGIHLANIYEFPDMIVYKKISFLNVLERVEVLLSFNNILNSLFIILMSIYFIKELIGTFIGKKKEPIILVLIGILVIILSNILSFDIYIYLIINFIVFIVTLILFFIHYLNKHSH